MLSVHKENRIFSVSKSILAIYQAIYQQYQAAIHTHLTLYY